MEGRSDIAIKIRELRERAQAGTAHVAIAFCGLFSAGKSSLLNALCETSLATGAVPTTAEVNVIDLPNAHERVRLMDTPGIDSTDPTHQQATLEAMHRADLVALVMDYQHVESDENLLLAQSLTQQGKRLLLIVNQVDKHLEWELPFDAYQRRVEQTFQDWDIEYERLYFTSTEMPDGFDLERLRANLVSYGRDAEHLQNHGMLASLKDLIQEHVRFTYQTSAVRAETTLESLGEPLPNDVDEAQERAQDFAQQASNAARMIANRQSNLLAALQVCRDSLVRSVELAQIAPYETTELGRHYVESLRPDFKVGWFQSKAKTDAERSQRLRRFVEDLASHTEKFLTWPTQASLRDFAVNFTRASSDWLADIGALKVTVTENLCESVVKQGALVSGQYPYQYVKDVVAAIKRSMTADIHNCIDKWTRDLEDQLDADSAEDSAQIDVFHQKQKAYEQWMQVQVDMRDRERTLLNAVTDTTDVWRTP